MLFVKMPFPDSPRLVYGESPLVEVICQLRFPPVLDISAAEPAAFQRAIIERYPEYEKEDAGAALAPALNLPPEVANLVSQFGVGPAGTGTYRFMSENRLSAIALTRDWIAVTDRAYERWERFRADLELATRTLEQVYRPPFFSRIGLRYRNVIDRRQLGLEEVAWETLLNPELLGVMLASPEFREAVERIESLAVVSIDEIPGGFVTLRHGIVAASQDGEISKYFIDADFHTEDREATRDVLGTVDRFNRFAGRLFRWAITNQLHEALRPMGAQ